MFPPKELVIASHINASVVTDSDGKRARSVWALPKCLQKVKSVSFSLVQ